MCKVIQRTQYQNHLSEKDIQERQSYFRSKYPLVVDLVLKKKADTQISPVTIEHQELEAIGVKTNGFGIQVFLDVPANGSHSSGVTNPQIYNGTNYAWVSIIKDTTDSEDFFLEVLSHEVIHALDFIGYYDLSYLKGSASINWAEETPETVAKKTISNNMFFPEECLPEIQEWVKKVLYHCSIVETYANMADVKYHLMPVVKKHPYYPKKQLEKLLLDCCEYYSIKRDAIQQYSDDIQKAAPSSINDVKDNRCYALLYTILKNHDTEEFAFPNLFPQEYNADTLFEMNDDEYVMYQNEYLNYLELIWKMFSKVTESIINELYIAK